MYPRVRVWLHCYPGFLTMQSGPGLSRIQTLQTFTGHLPTHARGTCRPNKPHSSLGRQVQMSSISRVRRLRLPRSQACRAAFSALFKFDLRTLSSTHCGNPRMRMWQWGKKPRGPSKETLMAASSPGEGTTGTKVRSDIPEAAMVWSDF